VPWQGYLEGGSGDPRAAANPPQRLPHAMAEQAAFDFGTMDVAATGSHAFTIQISARANWNLRRGVHLRLHRAGCAQGSRWSGPLATVEVHWKSKGG